MKSRYGAFNIKDYILYLAMGCLLFFCGLFTIVLIELKWECVFVMIIAVFMVARLLLPYREKYSIHTDGIKVRVGKRERYIPLPKRLIIVISLTDLPGKMGIQSYALDEKYSLTLLENLSAEEFLQRYRATRASIYITSLLEEKFAHHFLYSFVYDSSAMKQILAGRECTIIAPKSMAHILGDDIDDTIHLIVDTQY